MIGVYIMFSIVERVMIGLGFLSLFFMMASVLLGWKVYEMPKKIKSVKKSRSSKPKSNGMINIDELKVIYHEEKRKENAPRIALHNASKYVQFLPLLSYNFINIFTSLLFFNL